MTHTPDLTIALISWTADLIFEVQENRGPVFKSV